MGGRGCRRGLYCVSFGAGPLLSSGGRYHSEIGSRGPVPCARTGRSYQGRYQEMKSFDRPDEEAVGVCTKCGKALAREEVVMVDGKIMCGTCVPTQPSAAFGEQGPIQDKWLHPQAEHPVSSGVSYDSSRRLYRSRRNQVLSLIHISEPTRLGMISYAVFCLKKKKKQLSKNDLIEVEAVNEVLNRRKQHGD